MSYSVNITLGNLIKDTLDKTAQRDCKEIKKQWNDQKKIQGNAEIKYDIVPTDNGTKIAFKGSGQKAWISEFGKGSLMDRENENPYLKDYKNSSQWNPKRNRNGYSVRGRPEGSYTDLDGNKQESSGKAAKGSYGLNLEKGLKPHTDDAKYEPIKGEHIMRNVILNSDTGIHQMMEVKLGDILIKSVKEVMQK